MAPQQPAQVSQKKVYLFTRSEQVTCTFPSALETLQPLLAASKQQQAALHGWAHTLCCDSTARQQLESALRPLLTEEV